MRDLINTANDLFRKALHNRYPDRVKCPTCRNIRDNQEMTIGHSHNRNILPLMWHEQFACLQCWGCNSSGRHEGKLKEYFRNRIPGWDEKAASLRQIRIDRWEVEKVIQELKKGNLKYEFNK